MKLDIEPPAGNQFPNGTLRFTLSLLFKTLELFGSDRLRIFRGMINDNLRRMSVTAILNLLVVFLTTALLPETKGYRFDSGSCGKVERLDHLSMNGVAVLPGELPWVTLEERYVDRGVQRACSGTLITKRHVLTAAHCFTQSRQCLPKIMYPRKGGFLRIMVGSDCVQYPCNEKRMYYVSNVFLPPEVTKYGRHDVAIYELEEEVEESEAIPICLPISKQFLKGDVLEAAGWGYDPNRPRDTLLQKITYQRRNMQVDNGMYMMKGGNRSMCLGDSGSGLYHISGKKASIIGILSKGVTCSRVLSGARSIDGFVRVFDWVYWITSILGGELPPNTIHYIGDSAEHKFYRIQ
ncbi:hypothetical protein Q1695_003867 [Nippostrongylus brasiliensis]|nr:hypothetical protein Q1695_003867 [Nippostrongylus brasiliensis]